MHWFRQSASPARVSTAVKPGEKPETWMVEVVDSALREFQKQWGRPKNELGSDEMQGVMMVAILLNSIDLATPQVILAAEPFTFMWRDRVRHLVDLLIKGDTTQYRASQGDGRRGAE